MNRWLIALLLPILTKLLPRISEEAKKFLDAGIKELYEKAKATDNPFDDLAINLIAGILGVELED